MLAAYLDDISCPAEAFLLRPYRHALQAEGPKIGLHFDTAAKNYLYVPRCFAEEVRASYSDAAVVDDATPGSSPKAQLEFGARQLAAGSSGPCYLARGDRKVHGFSSTLTLPWHWPGG